MLLIIVHTAILITTIIILVLNGGPADDTNGSVAAVEKNFSINCSNVKKKVSIITVIIVICLVMEKEFLFLNPLIQNVYFPTQFVSRKHFVESEEVSFFQSITMLFVNLIY